jgi:SAM-dependent methyltransferase
LELTPELWKCRSCKSWFSQNIVLEKVAASLYSQGSSADRWSNKPFEESKQKTVIKILADIFNKGLKVLDIGCNTGSLLDFAKSKGCITAGIEVSSDCKDIIESKGHIYYPSPAEIPDDNHFDVITAFDLVEHLYDLSSFLKYCKSKLTKDGLIVISTGNIFSLSAAITQSRWWYIGFPEHIVFPSTIFFRDHSGLVIKKRLQTYAAKGYRLPVHRILSGFVKGILNSNYSGLPSLGADHVLLVLGAQ